MHDTQCAGQAVVLQVEVERPQLRCRQHPLVHEGLTGKAWEVDGFAARAVLTGPFGAELVFSTFAHHVGAAFQIHAGGAGDEHLTEGRHRVAGQRPERGVVGRHVAPPDDVQPLGLGDLLHRLACDGRVLRRLRQEGDTGGVGARFGQLEVDDRPQELVGHLQQNPGTVAGVRLRALGAPVLQVQQGGDGLVDDVAAATTVHVGHHRHAARIVLERGVVQPLTTGRHSHLPFFRAHAFAERRDGNRRRER